MHLKLWLLLVFLLSYSSLASEMATRKSPHRAPIWNCQIFAEITGDGSYYMIHGHDSWKGQGSFYCESQAGTYFKPVSLKFNSSIDGFGADTNSKVQLMIALRTMVAPQEFQLRALVNDVDTEKSVGWQFVSEMSHARIFVVNSPSSLALRSLQLGMLYIWLSESSE